MARHGITYDDVSSAANSLKGEGKSITIENVRRFLGTGSAGTVNQHLRRWKEIQNSSQKIATKENLPEPLIALVQGLWEGVITQSIEQFTPIEANYQQEISELKMELEKFRTNNQRWQKMFNQWQQEKTTYANEKLTLEQALEFAHKENQALHSKNDVLLRQLQEKQERIEELHRLHQLAQSNLEHYRESAREQRLLDQQQFEREKQQFLFEAKEMQEQLVGEQVKHGELLQKHQLIERSHIELELIRESLKKEIQQLGKTNVEYQQASQHWQNQFQELQKSFEAKLREVTLLQSDLANSKQRLVDAKELLLEAQSQNKLLASEKWELAQAKAQLEGQIKQMQNMSSIVSS